MNQLRRIREETGRSVKGLARITGVSRQTIYDLERGHRTGNLETWLKLAAALDTSVEEVSGEVYEPLTQYAGKVEAPSAWRETAGASEAEEDQRPEERLTDEPSSERRAEAILEKVDFIQRRNALNRGDYQRWKKGQVSDPDPLYPYIKYLDMEAGDRSLHKDLEDRGISTIVEEVRTGSREASLHERQACDRLVMALATMYGITAEARNVAYGIRNSAQLEETGDDAWTHREA